MPGTTQYEVLLDFTNDTHDCATVQLQRDYGRGTGAIVLLHPGESVTLVLDAGEYPRCGSWPSTKLMSPGAGTVYKYALKTRSRVANVTCVGPLVSGCAETRSLLTLFYVVARARAWRDVRCTVSQLFPSTAPASAHPPQSPTSAEPLRPVQGITVDQLWRDMRFCIWNDA